MMPRKIKTAFDGAPDADRSLTGIHDIAFLARERDGIRGVEVRVGGGTSIMPRIAPTLYDFVGLDDGEYLKVAEACFRIFDRQDLLRVNRARARIKVLVDKIGIDAFRELVDEELQGDWVAERDFDVAGLRFDIDEEATAPQRAGEPTRPERRPGGVRALRADNVQAQRQEGFSTVHVKVTRGDLTPEQLRAIAEIMRRYSGGYMRTTVHQNFVLRWVRDETVYEVWRALDALGLADVGPDTITDVVSCPGTDSCKLGITSSMGLNAALQQRLEEMRITDPLTRALHIKMSGCPNGCSQHHIANIGFYGASIKVGEHTIPAYVAHMAGNFEGGEIVYGQRLKVRLPAKRVPDAVERWLRWYEAEREEGEEFNAFAARVGAKAFEDKVRDLAMPVEFGLDTMTRSSTGIATCRSRSCGARASARSDAQTRLAGSLTETLRPAAAHERLVFLCSFQKEESVILDELLAIAPHARVVTIDTGVLFPETLATWRAFEERFGVRSRSRSAGTPPGPVPSTAAAREGRGARARAGRRRRLGHRHPPRAGPDPRAARSSSRSTTRRGGIAKYNPLALWTEQDLWRRIHERDLPYHPLHDDGYASIGCAPCTQPGGGREGRWAGTDKTECGLHV